MASSDLSEARGRFLQFHAGWNILRFLIAGKILFVGHHFRVTVSGGMLGKLKQLPSQLLIRRCVMCGSDANSLGTSATRRCARCGCNFTKRPARSYAEMEGLVPTSLPIPKPIAWPRNEVHLAHRWLAFMFFWAVLLGAIACLSFAALGSV